MLKKLWLINYFFQDIIEKFQSPWSAPLLVVFRKDGTWRPVIDYRHLNKVMVRDRFPLLVISDLLQSFFSKKVFSLHWILCWGSDRYLWIRRVNT